MGLGAFAPVPDRIEQLRIEACQAGQVLGVDLVSLALAGEDQPQFTSIGHQDLVAALLEHSANPGRVGSRLYCYAHRLLRSEAYSEGFGGGA